MGKRANGEGCFRQQKSGRWSASVSIEGQRYYVSGHTREEASEKLDALKLAHSTRKEGSSEARGEQVEQVFTVGMYLMQWLDEAVAVRNRPRTAEGYRNVVERHIIPALGNLSLTGLRPQSVQTFLNRLVRQGYSPNTVRNVRSVLRRALNVAIRWGYINSNAAVPVDVPQPAPSDITPLSLDDAHRLLTAVRGHPLEALYAITLLYGLRRGEVLALRLKDLDFEQGTIRVQGSIQEVKKGTVRLPPKTRASTRSLPIPRQLRPLLEEQVARQQKLHGGDSLLFATKSGKPVSPRNLVRHFKEMLVKAGLRESIRFHDLRHTAATRLIRQGTDVRTVMGVMGHTQASTTLMIYSHVVSEATVKAIDQFGEQLFGGSAP
jgi:integrase